MLGQGDVHVLVMYRGPRDGSFSELPMTAGEDCTYSSECESFHCIQPQKGAQGYCAPVSSGGGCSGDDRACTKDSYCDTTTMQCAPRKDAGEICHRPEQCNSGVCSPQKLCVAINENEFCDGK